MYLYARNQKCTSQAKLSHIKSSNIYLEFHSNSISILMEECLTFKSQKKHFLFFHKLNKDNFHPGSVVPSVQILSL